MPAPKQLSEVEVKNFLSDSPGWEKVGTTIERRYKARSFMEGIGAIQAIARYAEDMDHHPDIHVHYREVTFTLWTHVSGGVTQLDIDLARKIDEVWAVLSS